MSGPDAQAEPHAESHAELPRTDDLAMPDTFLLHKVRPFAQWVFRRQWDVEVHHPERMPATGPVVMASNHVGVIDGPLLAIFAPRPVHALTKSEMFGGPLGEFLLRSGQISLDRMDVDMRAVRTSVRVLRGGGAVGIFPEGIRGAGEFDLFHTGAAYLAMVTGAPIVPVSFIGTREPGGSKGSLPPRRAHLDMVLGTPFEVERVAWPRRREAVRDMSRMLRAKMLVDLRAALDETGRSLPGPLPAGQSEIDPGGGVTERSA